MLTSWRRPEPLPTIHAVPASDRRQLEHRRKPHGGLPSPRRHATPVRGRLPFPQRLPQDNQKYETFPATYPLRTHYLPTRECLKAARERFGPQAAYVLSAWHDVWRAAVGDVDAFAAGIGMDPLGPERQEDAPKEYPGWYGPNFIRPASFHVLEDAVSLIEALRVGTPFAVKLRTRRAMRYFVPVPA